MNGIDAAIILVLAFIIFSVISNPINEINSFDKGMDQTFRAIISIVLAFGAYLVFRHFVPEHPGQHSR